MNLSKWSPTLLSMLMLIFTISCTDASIRDKRAPHISLNKSTNGVTTIKSSSAAESLLVKSADKPDIDGVQPKKIDQFKIAETAECAGDVQMFCSDKINSNNLLVLDCLQDNEKIVRKLSESCHHILWDYKLKLTRDLRFEQASSQACANELENIPVCKSLDRGEIIPCLIEHYEDIKSKHCSQFLNKVASIIFSDYRLMNFFIKDCNADILALSCGRLDSLANEDDSPHSQGHTVACLNSHRKSLSKACKKSLLRVAELQSEDFHLDRPLYYACRNDRDNLCHAVVAGEGAVFKCLYKFLADDRLSHECRAELERRQQLIAEDVKADGSFYVYCKEDIRANDCAMKGSMDRGGEENFGRSSILLCLEEAQSKQKEIKPECLREMFDLRSMLMQDYKLSPELVSACEDEIKTICPLIQSFNVLQCLMKAVAHSRQNKDTSPVSSECKIEVTKLVEVVNPGEDIHLDAPLMRVCGDVVDHACSEYVAGQGEAITCLLENLDHEDMTDECEDELLVIQYFAARNFRLDFQLFKHCRNDAMTLCQSNGFSDPSSMKSNEGSIIFSCLHRHLRSSEPNDSKPSRSCMHEIKRVMRERSYKINLMPEVEYACLEDLASHCTDENEHNIYGGEMECLQSALDSLTEKCKEAVSNFTQEISQDLEVDRTLMRACHSMATRFCSDLLNGDAMPLEVLDCLIENKDHNEMLEKCATSIEHHQIVSLKDFKFNAKFRKSCDHSVSIHCKSKKTKYEVMTCLSELVRNDTINDAPQRIADVCRKQLKFELLQRGESLNLDPELEKNCETEILDFCQNKKNEGEAVECLRDHKGRLSEPCYQVLFQREKDDALFGDYSLLHACKDTITKFCSNVEEETDILKCLIEHKNHFQHFDERCRNLVQSRQIEQAEDIELNPHLQKACRLDIPKFCSDVYKDRSHKANEREGKVIECLKKTYASKNKVLTEECKREVLFRLQESAMDINLNPVLMKICKSDVKQFCLDNIAMMKTEDVDGSSRYNVFGTGAIMECLKKHFKDLKVAKCKEEVAYAVAESRVDLNVDPALHTACQQDVVTHCKEIAEGQGRQMSCLLSYLASNPTALTRNCKQLLQSRKNLWESAAQVAPAESFSDILDQMSLSPSRNYFFAILFTVVGVIFIVGLTCGRVTKRVRAEIKNK